MITNLFLNKILWSITTILSLIAAIYGFFNNHIYQGLMPAGFVAAQYGQDILTILVCILLFHLIYRTHKESVREPIMIIGIIGSLAYLYGIFSIERVYNELYLLFLAILSSSSFALALFLSSLNHDYMSKYILPKAVRVSSAVLSILIGILFSFLWIGALIPLMRSHQQIDNLFSIYLLDLVFVMPAFFITAILSLRNNALGYLLTPAMDILGIFVIFPLGLGELIKPFFGLSTNSKDMIMSFTLSGIFFISAVIQLFVIHKKATHGR